MTKIVIIDSQVAGISGDMLLSSLIEKLLIPYMLAKIILKDPKYGMLIF
jgi:uncharacterized protein (DUF111 family)